jgi:hypothetical protein
MKRLRKVGGAMAVAVTVAVMMGVGSARLEAKGKPNPVSGNEAICAYLTSVIEYPGINPTILAFALSLYNYYDCAGS